MFGKTRKTVLTLLFLTFLFSGCSDYQKLLKSSDYDLLYEKAMEYYQKEEYTRAASLFENLVAMSRGTDRAEEVIYHYAYCYYHQADYLMAEYYFNNYISAFPNSSRTEECAFMVAYCHYKQSPKPSLDQASTYKAINELQLFMNRYPTSTRVAECNLLVDELRDKLVQKSYDGARLYFSLKDYQASITALNNSLKEFPETRYREEILFLVLKSSYELARNSVFSKVRERYEATIEAYQVLLDQYPQTKHLREAERIQAASRKAINL